MKILLVEDDPELRFVVSSLLSAQKHQVVEATDGETAIEKFRQDPTFDTVLVDIGLDKMDGVQVCAEIKSISKPTRVIVMSGLISQERMKEIEAAGADGVLPKPFQMPALFDVLKPRD